MQFLLSKKLLHIGKLYNKLIAGELPEIQSDWDVVILSVLYSNQSRITQQQLANILAVDKLSVGVMIFSLVQRGYLTAERNPADRRERHIALTAMGILLIPKIQCAIDKVNHQVSRQITEESLISFYAVLVQMLQNLNTVPGLSIAVRN